MLSALGDWAPPQEAKPLYHSWYRPGSGTAMLGYVFHHVTETE